MRQLTGIVCAAMALLNPGAREMVEADTKQSVEEIRKELLQLPYYGVFDFLAFSYDRGTVVVGGYAYALGLKKALTVIEFCVRTVSHAPRSQHRDLRRHVNEHRCCGSR
ncbi:MAG: hypothetical protein C5B57_06325 [Blastocatellia bacterium]|nr:MAG: hypothetical protein C5B57_06325 [Blastocatellia bacterium]